MTIKDLFRGLFSPTMAAYGVPFTGALRIPGGHEFKVGDRIRGEGIPKRTYVAQVVDRHNIVLTNPVTKGRFHRRPLTPWAANAPSNRLRKIAPIPTLPGRR